MTFNNKIKNNFILYLSFCLHLIITISWFIFNQLMSGYCYFFYFQDLNLYFNVNLFSFFFIYLISFLIPLCMLLFYDENNLNISYKMYCVVLLILEILLLLLLLIFDPIISIIKYFLIYYIIYYTIIYIIMYLLLKFKTKNILLFNKFIEILILMFIIFIFIILFILIIKYNSTEVYAEENLKKLLYTSKKIKNAGALSKYSPNAHTALLAKIPGTKYVCYYGFTTNVMGYLGNETFVNTLISTNEILDINIEYKNQYLTPCLIVEEQNLNIFDLTEDELKRLKEYMIKYNSYFLSLQENGLIDHKKILIMLDEFEKRINIKEYNQDFNNLLEPTFKQ